MKTDKTTLSTNALPPPIPASLLPRSICAFDIETARGDARHPERCEIACAGALVYKRAGSSWRQAGYRWFGAGELSELATFLRGFPGLIIGHNVFNFDYRVLRPHVSLEGIIEKTVDLLLALQNISRSRDADLTLASLARINLRRRKLGMSRSMPRLWRAGEHRHVLAHNKRDCELTAELWMHLLRRRGVRTFTILGILGIDSHILTPDALALLAGRTPQLAHAEWLSRIETWGNAIRPPDYYAKKYHEEPNAGRRPLFHSLFCTSCRRKFILAARRKRWFRRNETLACPFCQHPVRVDILRVTLTWRRKTAGTVRFAYGLGQPSRIPASRFPDPHTARAWINRLYVGPWW